jgi:hypothetical protein
VTYYNSTLTGRTRSTNVTATVEDEEVNIYTCPPNVRAHMSLLYVINVTGANCTVDVVWNRADGSHAHILGDRIKQGGEAIQFSNGFIVLEPGDEINITPTNQNNPHIDAFCTVEEFFPNKI